ncbi:hypothetical protein Q0F99_15630 [Rathayibacter oskolensis]|nr:hypothetical protein [Rathayibacter oskolensis]WKK71050.1 hypothetical protein Q0F99_15630 [Rathayibacter oskolensis]
MQSSTSWMSAQGRGASFDQWTTVFPPSGGRRSYRSRSRSRDAFAGTLM